MHKFKCLQCGKTVVNESKIQGRKFCSKDCSKKWHSNNRDYTEVVCKYNEGVMCSVQKCNICGWNPEVEKARKEKLNG